MDILSFDGSVRSGMVHFCRCLHLATALREDLTRIVATDVMEDGRVQPWFHE